MALAAFPALGGFFICDACAAGAIFFNTFAANRYFAAHFGARLVVPEAEVTAFGNGHVPPRNDKWEMEGGEYVHGRTNGKAATHLGGHIPKILEI